MKTTHHEKNSGLSGSITCAWGVATDKGRTRLNNEDSYVGNGVLFAVADGLGGHEGGQIASQLAVNVLLRETFQSALPLGPDPRHWLRGGENTKQLRKSRPGVYALYKAFQEANREITVKAQSDLQLASMGTTLCALQLHTDTNDAQDRAGAKAKGGPSKPEAPYFAIANVGDSRIYHLSGRKLKQISIDHTFVADLVRNGIISDAEAAIHKQRHELTRALGGYLPVLEVDFWELPAQVGDRYLLCTDGLVLEIPDKGISKVLKKYSNPQAAANALMKAAVEAGGRDDITVLVVDVIDNPMPPTGRTSSPATQ